jgi:phosphoenolpyruvate carboxylase
LIEMVIAKADTRIAAEHDRRLETAASATARPRASFPVRIMTVAILAISGHRLPSGQLRCFTVDRRPQPVDPINLVQIGCWAASTGGGRSGTLRAFAVTVSGVAAGMRNTG